MGRIFLIGLLAWVGNPAAQVPIFDPFWAPVGPFSPAEACTSCHSATPLGQAPAVMRAPTPGAPDRPDSFGADISPPRGVRSSVLGHSLDDPYFHAVVEDEVVHFPGVAGAIEDQCLRCHAPMGHYVAHSGDGGQLDADGFYRMELAITEHHAREGVGCTFCHQIEIDPDLELANGAYRVRADGGLYGPYPDPVGATMAGYAIRFDSAVQQAIFCSPCHGLYTDVLDAESGEPTGERFLEQATFFEWRNSALGGPPGGSDNTTCQDCHMRTPASEYLTRIATRRRPELRGDYSPHVVAGGNTHLLSMLGRFGEALGLDPRLTAADFEPNSEATREMLREAATLELSVPSSVGEVAVDVTITNLTGHKLPSGFPSRRLWLHLRILDGRDRLLFESGAPDARGRLASDDVQASDACTLLPRPPGYDRDLCYTPHFDVIETSDQVPIYESVMADSRDEVTVLLLHARSYLKDNRIPPVGFLESGPLFLPETATFGVDDDPDFNAAGSGSDTVHYRIATAYRGPLTIEARLLYQSIRPQFIEGLHSAGFRVDAFGDFAAEVPPPAETVASAKVRALLVDPDPEIILSTGFEY